MEPLDARLAALREVVREQALAVRSLAERNRETTRHARRSVEQTRKTRDDVNALARKPGSAD